MFSLFDVAKSGAWFCFEEPSVTDMGWDGAGGGFGNLAEGFVIALFVDLDELKMAVGLVLDLKRDFAGAGEWWGWIAFGGEDYLRVLF
jgi:hypothetical protein